MIDGNCKKAHEHIHEIIDNTIEEFSTKLLKDSLRIKNINWDE